jgi:hypothetical protein
MPIFGPRMQKRYYNAAGLERALEVFERRFKIASADFYEAHRAEGDDSPLLKDVPRFERHIWADLYVQLRRLNGEDFAEQIERDLEIA